MTPDPARQTAPATMTSVTASRAVSDARSPGPRSSRSAHQGRTLTIVSPDTPASSPPRMAATITSSTSGRTRAAQGTVQPQKIPIAFNANASGLVTAAGERYREPQGGDHDADDRGHHGAGQRAGHVPGQQ